VNSGIFKRLLIQVGNAVTDDYHDYIGTFEYWWNHGLISDSTYHQLKTACYSVSSQHPSMQCMVALRNAELEQGNIDPYSIFTKPCNSTVALKRFLKGRYVSFTHPKEFSGCLFLCANMLQLCIGNSAMDVKSL